MPSISTSRQGDIAETAFAARATLEGFLISYPITKNCRYDCILDNGFVRLLIQVKSTKHLIRKHVYFLRACRSLGHGYRKSVPYTASEIDFLAAYIHPEDIWHILPIAAIADRKHVSLHSPLHPKPGPFGQFRNRWDLFHHPQSPESADRK